MMEVDLKLDKPLKTAILEISKGVSALTEGPLRRWNEKRDLIHAYNMCKIINQAQEKSDQALNVDSGWLLNVLDKCKVVSDPEVQDLWSSILAAESDRQGSFSHLTVNSLEKFWETRCWMVYISLWLCLRCKL